MRRLKALLTGGRRGRRRKAEARRAGKARDGETAARTDSRAMPLTERQARRLRATGQTGEAIALAREAASEARSPAKIARLTRILDRLDDRREALRYLEEAQARFPRSAALALAHARLLLRDGQRDAAIARLDALPPSRGKAAGEVSQVRNALKEGRARALGFELRLPAHIVPPDMLLRLLEGRYENAERHGATADIRPDDRVLELGAGIGIMALTIARAAPGVEILCVEANPELEPVIRENFALNGCSAGLEIGVAGLTDGQAPFYFGADFHAGSAVTGDAGARRIDQREIDINRLIESFRPTVLVLDIEGGEIALLPALKLDGVRRIVAEFHPQISGAPAVSTTLAALIAQGFALNLPQGKGNVLVLDRAGRPTETTRQRLAP